MPSALQIVHFGPFTLDLRSAELHRNGTTTQLAEQPFQVLTALLERPGEVVTRDELRQRLWGAETFVDFEHGLNTAVKRLREVLGDSAESPRYIETLPRHGYRLMVPVERAKPVATPVRFQSWTIWLALMALLLVVLALLLSWRLRGWERSRPPRIESLVVLPLEDLSPTPGQEYFSDGMTDELITNLSKVGSLRVVSRTTAMHYKRTNKTLPEIGRELKVDGVVEGSVVRSDNRVRITAQLIDARSERHLWADTYERDLGDVLKLQSEITRAIVRQVQAQLNTQQQARLKAAQVVSPQAYDAYLKGRFYRSTVSLSTPQAFEQAENYFNSAIQLDPSFAPAYAGLADCYALSGQLRQLPPEDAYRKAKEAVHRALDLDASLSEAHAVLGQLSWRHDWDWPTAERELRRAVELNPSFVDAHGILAQYLGWTGRRAEGLAEIDKIRDLDPDPTVALAWESAIYYHQRDYNALVEAGRRHIAANSHDWLGHYSVAAGYAGSKRVVDAIPEYQKAIELSQRNTDPIVGLAYAYAAAGRRESADKILHELQRQSKTSYVSPYMMAAMYASRGENNQALQFLEQAYQERSSDLVWFLKADFRVDSLRSDPRFQHLLERMRLPP